MSAFLPPPSMMVVFSFSMRDALGPTEHLQRHVLELDAKILGNHRARGEDRDVLEHRLAAVAEAGRLDRCHLQAATQLVDDQGRERFAFDVLGDDEERLASLHDRFQDGEHRLQRGELLLVDEDVGVLELGQHLLGVGDEIGREIAAVELHALDDVELGLGRLRLFDRDDALVADLLHGVGNHLADRLVAVRGDGPDLRDLIRRLHLLGALFDVLDHRTDRNVDAALEIHRVHASGDELRPSFMIGDPILGRAGRRHRAHVRRAQRRADPARSDRNRFLSSRQRAPDLGFLRSQRRREFERRRCPRSTRSPAYGETTKARCCCGFSFWRSSARSSRCSAARCR